MGRKSKGQTKQNKRKMAEKRKPDDSTKDDDRFMDLAKNPMFREMSKKERKVKIDDRFKQMLSNKCFQERDFLVDRRGRPVKQAGEDYLKRIYELDGDKDNNDESSSSDVEPDEDEPTKQQDADKNDGNESDVDSSFVDDENEAENDEEDDDKDLPEIQLDLARGQGNISSSSSDEEMDDEKDDYEMEDGSKTDEKGGNNWGELDKEVRRVEWASRRLAICNLDWGKVKAEDLMLVLTSFKPSNGEIHSISVYLSDFGEERIQIEKRHGPVLKLKPPKKGDDEDLEERTKQAIREYELDKLRYYYAVCVCDTIETASEIYEACDGVEYESSGLRFDVRFIPDEMQFEDERVREKITAEQFDPTLYKPKKIETHSLVVSNPTISWEDTDKDRRRKLKEAFNQEAKLDEFDSLIASGSEDEEERKAKYELLMAAMRGDETNAELQKTRTDKNVDEEQLDESGKEISFPLEAAKGLPLNDGKDRELTDEEVSDEEAVEIRRPKKKTKFQLYLERKKQLKQERKQKEVEERKQRKQKMVHDDEESTGKEAEFDRDERFTALFTDSAFAIDRTSASYKGGNLADRQVKGKQKRRFVHQHQENTIGQNDETESEKKRKKGAKPENVVNEDALLVEKLKRKSARKKL